MRRVPPGAMRSITCRYSITPARCRALCDPLTLPVSSLIHRPPGSWNPRLSSSGADRASGVSLKPVPIDAGDGSVQRLDELHEVVVGQAGVERHLPRREAPPPRQERDVPQGRDRRLGRHAVRRRSQHVIAVVTSTEVRTVEARPQQVGCRHDRCRRRRSETRRRVQPSRGQAADALALNSSIMASHAGSRSCRLRQNGWWRRASNSATETPCCSTHV